MKNAIIFIKHFSSSAVSQFAGDESWSFVRVYKFMRKNDIKYRDKEEFDHKEKSSVCCNAKEILVLKQN